MEELLKLAASYGPTGLGAAILGFVIWRLFGLYADVQEKRLAESREMLPVLRDVEGSLRKLGETVASNTASTQANTDATRTVVADSIRRRE